MRRRELEVEMGTGEGAREPFLWEKVRARLRHWKAVGARPEVLRWIRMGVPVVWERGPPPPFRGKAYPLKDEERKWFFGGEGREGELQRLERLGAWRVLTEEEAARAQHVSPAFLVPKPDKNGAPNFRCVVDLRRINAFCKRYALRMETLRVLGRMAREGDWMIGFDISDAFYHVPLRVEDRRYFTFQMGEVMLQLLALPMGWNGSCYFLSKILRTVVGALRGGGDLALLRQNRDLVGLKGGQAKVAAAAEQAAATPGARRRDGGQRRRRCRALAYLDDFMLLFSSEEEAREGAAACKELLASLGLTWEPAKCNWEPVQTMTHLGLGVDTKRGLFLVTEKRQKKIERMAVDLICRQARGNRRVPTRLLASFTGLCQSIDLACSAARFFLRELYSCAARAVEESGWNGQTRLTRQAVRDLQWWKEFRLNSPHSGRAIWRPVTTATLSTDACVDEKGRGGWGAILHGEKPLLARGFWRPHQRDWHIQRLELLAVRLGVESFLERLRGRKVRLLGDNQAVVSFVEKFTSRSPELMKDIRKLWWLLDSEGIEVCPEWISSHEMELDGADGLSRQLDAGDWSLVQEVFEEYNRRWGPITWDRFASPLNKKHPDFNGRWVGPGCPPERVDGLSQTDEHWRQHMNFCNPPWGLLPQVVQKLRESGAAAIVVAPFTPSATWYTELVGMSETLDVLSKDRDIYQPGLLGGQTTVGAPKFSTMVCKVPLRTGRPE